jgi:outer membrane protein TolC
MNSSIASIRFLLSVWMTAIAGSLLSACAPVGPDYVRPATTVALSFTETGPWTVAEPQDDISRGDWWSVFADPVLNDLQTQAVQQNPDLRAVASRISQAQAITGISSSYLYPEINLGLVNSRSGISPNSTSDSPNIPVNVSHGYTPTFNANGIAIPLYANYEVQSWWAVTLQKARLH